MFKSAEQYLDLMLELKKSRAPLETILQKLREAGASQMTSIQLLMSVFDLSLRQADELVLNSQTWEDCYEATTSLRDSAWKALANSAGDVEIDGDHIRVTFDLTKDQDANNTTQE